MTAIQTSQAANNSNKKSPLHAIEASKFRFTEAVANGVSELMQQHGYSRERAMLLLLRELKRGDTAAPADRELFGVMKEYGIGMEEASKALIVSRAMSRAQKERGLSVANAIDDLTSRMKLSNLLKPNDVVVAEVSNSQAKKVESTATLSRSVQRKTTRSLKLAKQKLQKNKPVVNKPITSRKRSKSKEDTIELESRRARAHIVSEEVIAKKAKLSCDETNNATNGRSMSPTQIVRNKRVCRGEDAQASATPMKRARTNDA